MIKLITLPFAGGNKYSYPFLKNHSSVISLEYPGRGKRIKEELVSTIDELVLDLYNQINHHLNDDYFIYGHSMGALLGYLLCLEIEKRERRKPVKLIVSGKIAPSVKKNDWKFSKLQNKEFWRKMTKMGGMPNRLDYNHKITQLYIPILKSDFKLIEEYKYIETKKLNIPIDVFYGTREKIKKKDILPWENETTEKVTFEELKGNHFFIFKHKDFFTQYFTHLLQKNLNTKVDKKE